jgi:8-oxo-dGTP diphosphatase
MDVQNQYFKSAFSVDNVLFGFDQKLLKVLLIKRGEQPFEDYWALPGDLVYPDEDLIDAPLRVLNQLIGINNMYLEQVKAFGKKDRHPHGRVITIAYLSLVNVNKVQLKPSSFAQIVKWIPVESVVELAFDHVEILTDCLNSLKQSVQHRPIGFELLEEKFTLSDLQELYEAILGTSLDKRNFRKKLLSMGILVDTKEFQTGVAHRPARLYSFDEEKYENLKRTGFTFDI